MFDRFRKKQMDNPNNTKIIPIGPSSCGGCATSCFSEKIGMPIELAFDKDLTQKFEILKDSFKQVDVAFRQGKMQEASQYKKKALDIAGEILSTVNPNQIPIVAETIDLMASRHCGTKQSYEFLIS